MKGQKKRKLKQDSPHTKINRTTIGPKYQFNISYDNLKCFINPSKSIRIPKKKIPVSISKIKSIVQESNHIKLKINQNKAQQPIEKHSSPDLSRQLSNSILKKIEIQGIFCKWEQEQVNQLNKQDQEDDRRLWRTFSQYSYTKSYASTTDLFGNIYTLTNPYQIIQYQKTLSKQYDPNNFQIQLENIGNDPRTTIMIKNIPNKYSIQDLSKQIDNTLENTYDFLYLPCDLKNQCNVGYGFINFIDTCYLVEFYQAFHNKKWLKFRSDKICILTYARLQGLQSLIQHFQNSKVLNQKDKKYRPIIKQLDKIQHLIKKQQQDQIQQSQI